MQIKSVKFDRSISFNFRKENFFDNKKQIVFVWRSNVWKSSLLNALFNKKNLVKTSSIPWKTKTANLFLVNNKYYFVDLPWYWFAKLWQSQREKLDLLISLYIEEFKYDIKKVVIILDSRLWPTDKDIDMFKFLSSFSIPIIFCLNKIDKLSKNELNKSLNYTQEIFFWQQIILTSSKTKDWIADLLKILWDSLK